MKCHEVEELFSLYWDLPEDDLRRFRVHDHIKRCGSCREQFQFWEESNELIRSSALPIEPYLPVPPVSEKVMQQIYSSESWRLPVSQRIYTISHAMRRNFTVLIAGFLLLFMFSFMFSLGQEKAPEEAFIHSIHINGLHQVASAIGDSRSLSSGRHVFHVPVASISEPMMLKVNPIRSNPNYYLAMSLLGLSGALLVMNWFARTRA